MVLNKFDDPREFFWHLKELWYISLPVLSYLPLPQYVALVTYILGIVLWLLNKSSILCAMNRFELQI